MRFCSRVIARTLDIALRHHRVTLLVFLGSLVATALVFIWIPKGFFPIQDTGLIIGSSEAAQDISFSKMVERQLALGRVVAADPDVTTVGMQVGVAAGQTLNTGRLFITLKPRDQRTASAMQIIDRLRPKLAEVEGAALFLQPAQDINVGGRLARAQFQYTLLDADPTELNSWAPKLLAKLRTLPELTDVATDQENRRHDGHADD